MDEGLLVLIIALLTLENSTAAFDINDTWTTVWNEVKVILENSDQNLAILVEADKAEASELKLEEFPEISAFNKTHISTLIHLLQEDEGLSKFVSLTMVAENSLFQDARYVNRSLTVIAGLDICKDFVFAIVLEQHPPHIKISNPMSHNSKEVCEVTKEAMDLQVILGVSAATLVTALVTISICLVLCKTKGQLCWKKKIPQRRSFDKNPIYGEYAEIYKESEVIHELNVISKHLSQVRDTNVDYYGHTGRSIVAQLSDRNSQYSSSE